ncbi:lethal(3)malignant brain tumor-like protein 3 isoform X2 [Zeugodacus cucurbitae]|uniref:lethal(3)malignant brain tumor-like protein 3 isoform X2 n=1 Tax=Zeugodacus cucurbitae TaxID=28588 RepID=UPI0023D9010C|nr:lethal(3)malignant brain tumor-like protein 3 isoform X2 [Zeugodacus cucurbitae]
MNISGGDTSGTKLVSHRTSNIVSSTLNNNSPLTYMPQVAFITPAVEPTPFPPNSCNKNTKQPCSSSAPSVMSVISCASNIMNNEHNNAGFVMSKNIHNNSTLSASAATLTINARGDPNSHTPNSIGVQASGTNIKIEGEALQMLQNSVIPASILVRNHQQYSAHGNSKSTVDTATRGGVGNRSTSLTTLNQELVKQIVVGNPQKHGVLPQLTGTNTNNSLNSTETLLKPTSTITNLGGIKQQNSSNKSTTNLTQTSVSCAASTTLLSSIGTSPAIKKQSQQLNALQNPSSLLQTPTNAKLPLSEAAKIAAGGSSKKRKELRTDECSTDFTFNSQQSIPPKTPTSTLDTAIQTKVPIMKTTSVTNSSVNNSGSFKVEIDLTKPVLVQPKLVEKQESLLKVRPVQRVTESSTSPRSKRSKSLSCAFKEHTLSERRHSTTSEGKNLKHKTSPPRRKQTLNSKCNVIGNEYEIIDLIDYNEEEHEFNADKEQTTNAEKENNVIGSPMDEDIIENQQDSTSNMKPPPPFNVTDRNSLYNTPKEVTKDVHNIEELPKLSSTKKNSEKYTSIEDDHIEEPSIKFEIMMKDVEYQTRPQQTVQSEKTEISIPDTKVEDTHASIEHNQDSLEKSLYCDEKISVSSTSSASTSSSRQSLHDDLQMSTSSNITQNMPIKPNQPSTSAAFVNTLAALPPVKAITNATEDSLSCALKMLSNFNMLTWNQRVGNARGTNMRFQLNEFNLIEINERCSPRTRIYTAYEKPIYERESVPYLSESDKGLLYLCRRCNCHGPALDFLAPEFCSLDCLKRESRKRRHEEYTTFSRKRKTQESYVPAPSKKSFRWSTYLPEKFNAIAAPVNLFINPFPTGPNRFQIGMKLEAIDPENCSLFCVCTIVDIQGYRLKLTFDGYEYMYDFWVNADSMDIFPPGWCAKTKRILQPPKGKTIDQFNWLSYLTECKSIAAQRALFTHLNASLGTHNPFKIGMHLEAEDLNDTGKLCVASVSDVLDNRIRVHFDGWDDCYDYWVEISSPYIHPCGWHVGRHQLIVPPEFENTTFSWTDYIKNHGSGMAATEEMFSTRDPIDFKPNMKLEVVDPRNASLIRPATVVGRKGHRVKLHLDCWPSNYCFWLEDDSADLHPIGWCEATSHDLEPPPGYKMRSTKVVCSTFGCRGIGNAKRLYLNTHTTQDCCPYAAENWRQKCEKPPRLEHEEIVRSESVGKRVMKQKQQQPLKWKQSQPPTHANLNEADILQHIQLLDNIKTRHIIQQEKPQHKQTTPESTNRIGIGSKREQQQTLIKTERIDKSTVNAVKVYQPLESTSAEQSTSLLIPQIKIAKEFLCDYGPRLQQNYNIWQRNVAFDMQRIKRNPLLWSTKDTCAFVQCVLRNADITEMFLREDIDGSALLLLQQSDLTETLGLKLGPAVKLFSCILQLRTLAVLKFNVNAQSCN